MNTNALVMFSFKKWDLLLGNKSEQVKKLMTTLEKYS